MRCFIGYVPGFLSFMFLLHGYKVCKGTDKEINIYWGPTVCMDALCRYVYIILISQSYYRILTVIPLGINGQIWIWRYLRSASRECRNKGEFNCYCFCQKSIYSTTLMSWDNSCLYLKSQEPQLNALQNRCLVIFGIRSMLILYHSSGNRSLWKNPTHVRESCQAVKKCKE